jgi:polysaccharide chain length determinant protein (PEP-CTERM system associated)
MIGHRQLTMEDYLTILRRHKWALIAFVVICPIAGYFLSFFLPKEYTSQTVILVEQPAIPESEVTGITSADLKQRVTTLQEQILSRSRLEALINEFNLYSADRKAVPMEALVDRLRRKIGVTPVKPMAESNSTQLPGFTIKVSDHDPVLAQKLCNEISSMFLSENRRVRHEQAQETTEFISQELTDAKAKMDERGAKLADFKQRYLGELPDDQQANLGILSGLNNQLDAATQAIIHAQQDKTFAETMLQQQVASQNGDSAQSLQKELSDRQGELATLQNKYTPEHPDVIKLKARIADLKQKIAESSKAGAPAAPSIDSVVASNPQVEQLRAQVHQYDSIIKEQTAQQRAVQQKIAKYEGRVQLSPNVEEQYNQLTRDSQAATEFYNSLLKKRSESAMESDINHQKKSGEFRVLDAANLPASPSFPNHLYFALGGLAAGIFLGLGLVVLGEARDKTLRTEQDVEFFLQLPTLANIPSVASAQRHAAKAAKEGPRLVANG